MDGTPRWRRVYQLGSKAEVLAWVRQPQGEDGPTQITLTTDAAADLVLHWGVTQQGEVLGL